MLLSLNLLRLLDSFQLVFTFLRGSCMLSLKNGRVLLYVLVQTNQLFGFKAVHCWWGLFSATKAHLHNIPVAYQLLEVCMKITESSTLHPFLKSSYIL